MGLFNFKAPPQSTTCHGLSSFNPLGDKVCKLDIQYTLSSIKNFVNVTVTPSHWQSHLSNVQEPEWWDVIWSHWNVPLLGNLYHFSLLILHQHVQDYLWTVVFSSKSTDITGPDDNINNTELPMRAGCRPNSRLLVLVQLATLSGLTLSHSTLANCKEKFSTMVCSNLW